MKSSVDLFKKVNIEKLSKAGKEVYDKIKKKYEPKYIGKFLAIEPESGDAFMDNDVVRAMTKAKRKYPKRLFYILKIGYAAVFTRLSPILLPD